MYTKRLYVLSAANAMTDHTFTDDVAICWAESKKEAAENYSYEDIENYISEPSYNYLGVAVLTDF